MTWLAIILVVFAVIFFIVEVIGICKDIREKKLKKKEELAKKSNIADSGDKDKTDTNK